MKKLLCVLILSTNICSAKSIFEFDSEKTCGVVSKIETLKFSSMRISFQDGRDYEFKAYAKSSTNVLATRLAIASLSNGHKFCCEKKRGFAELRYCSLEK